MKFFRRTNKLFYSDQTLFSTSTRLVKMVDDWVELQDTVAYPEGGGQDSDMGEITTSNGQTLRFVEAKKMYAHSPMLSDFPSIQVDGVVWHKIHPEDLEKTSHLCVDGEVRIQIDAKRRFENSLSHTASHLLYVAVAQCRPDVIAGTIGCHIKPSGARFDFSTPNRFTPEQVEQIQCMATELSLQNLDVFIQSHPDVADARIWCCADYKVPCGGTHLSSTTPIGALIVKRKSLGSGKERLSCEFPSAKPFDGTGQYLSIKNVR